jgi:hypothetical protein
MYPMDEIAERFFRARPNGQAYQEPNEDGDRETAGTDRLHLDGVVWKQALSMRRVLCSGGRLAWTCTRDRLPAVGPADLDPEVNRGCPVANGPCQ